MQPNPKHVDPRGFFQELYHPGKQENVAQVSWFSIEPNYRRGGHYHMQTTEVFVVLEGEVMYTSGIKNKILCAGESARSVIGEYHSFRNHTSREAKILVLSDKKFDPEHPDTYQ